MTDLFIPMLVGSVTILVFAAINKLTDGRFSPKWHYCMWLILLIITILPVKIHIDLPQKSTETQEVILDIPQMSQSEVTYENLPQNIPVKPEKHSINIAQYLPSMWAAGFVLMLISKLAGWLILISKVRKCPEIDINMPINSRIRVKKCSFCPSPVLIGIVRPTLVLPDIQLDEIKLKSILAHEMVHFRRGDVMVKWLVMFIKCVHWYNPLVHFAAAKCDEYCEISCDMEAVRNMDRASETAYMMTILSLASGKNYALGAGMSENGKILKRRFAMIKNKKTISRKTRFISLVCAFAIIFTSVFVSGVLANDDDNIKVFLHGKEIKLEHKPFVANNTVYLPIREMLNLENIPNEDITYFKGVVQFLTPDGKGEKYVGRVQIGSSAGYIGGYSHGSTENIIMAKPVVLSENTTYVPYDYFNKMLAVGLFEDFYAEVYDESGKIPLITGVGVWNEEKNFSLEMPLALHNDFIIAENEDSVVFGNDKGTLFTIRIKANDGEIVKGGDFIMSENGLTYTIEGGILSGEMVEYVKKSIRPIVHYIPLDGETKPDLILYPCESENNRVRLFTESHPAIDIACAEGTNVLSSVSGAVIEQGFNKENGNYIRLSNGTAEIFYAHLKDMLVKEGDRVNQGDVIATVGKTGMATGPHLHFEVKINGKHVDPATVWAKK